MLYLLSSNTNELDFFEKFLYCSRHCRICTFSQGISGVDVKFKASLVSLRFDPSCGFCLTEILSSSQIHHENAFYKSPTSLLTRAIVGPRERQLWAIPGFDQYIFCKGANQKDKHGFFWKIGKKKHPNLFIFARLGSKVTWNRYRECTIDLFSILDIPPFPTSPTMNLHKALRQCTS